MGKQFKLGNKQMTNYNRTIFLVNTQTPNSISIKSIVRNEFSGMNGSYKKSSFNITY